MAAYSASIRGASDIYVVDRVPERLAKAKEIGCIPIDFAKEEASDQIKRMRGGCVHFLLIACGYDLIDFCSKLVDRGVDGMPHDA